MAALKQQKKMGTTDKDRKIRIQKQQQIIDAQKRIIDGYSKQITDLRNSRTTLIEASCKWLQDRVSGGVHPCSTQQLVSEFRSFAESMLKQ